MTGAIIDLSKQAPPSTLSADVCIIGSGCGGATAARVLSEAGKHVIVLEEGGDFPAERFTQRDGEMYDQLYMERGGRASSDLSVSVLQGRVLGGGGIINACDVVPIPEGVLEHWSRRHGLSDFRPQAVEPYARLALEDLSAAPIPEAQVNRANRLLRAGTEALGLRGELMLHNRVGCAGMGTCLIGCPVDAKRNPRTVAIPAALAAGARFYVRARARRIEGASREIKQIVVRTLDERGYHERGELRVRAPIVIVAANAVASAELLLRSAIGNAHVGRHLMLQPQLPVTAVFDERVEAFRGIPQAYAVTEFEQHDDPKHGLWGFRIEAIMGTPGMVGSLLPFSGFEGKSAMSLYDRIAASLLLVPDAPSGAVRIESDGRLRIDYVQREEHRARLRQAVREAARIYLAAGARRVIVPTVPALVIESERDLARVAALELAPASAPLLSAHQQGSLRFSASSRDGALDPSGRVHGTRGIYVFDSSGFPSSASSHTMAPIITISRYLSARLLAS
jgi:choline dehydrogenase-like flavoprotein